MYQDLRYGARALLKTPGFSFIAIIGRWAGRAGAATKMSNQNARVMLVTRRIHISSAAGDSVAATSIAEMRADLHYTPAGPCPD